MCCCRKKKTLDVKYTGRHCTDVVCLALFGAAWFITIVILISASRTADTAAYLFIIGFNELGCLLLEIILELFVVVKKQCLDLVLWVAIKRAANRCITLSWEKMFLFLYYLYASNLNF